VFASNKIKKFLETDKLVCGMRNKSGYYTIRNRSSHRIRSSRSW